MTVESFIESEVGPRFLADGVRTTKFRGGRTGEMVVGQAHAPHYEGNSRNRVFGACLGAVATFGTSLTATGVTYHLCNPIGSGWDLVVLHCGVTILTAGTGGHLVYAYNSPHSTAVTAGTALSVFNRMGGSGVGLAKSATTLPAVPVALRTLAGAITAAGTNNISDYIDGGIIVSPGASLSVQGITIVGTGLISMLWEEVPLNG
jgi:hypothetical protein